MSTELPVGNPGIAFPVLLEGKGIYKYGLSVPELDIIGAGILQGHAVLKRELLNMEGQEGCPLQLTEAPFVRIGDERDISGLMILYEPSCVSGGISTSSCGMGIPFFISAW